MWKRLTINDLRLVFSEDEITKLDELSKSSEISAMIQSQMDVIADLYRGSWTAKGYTIDSRSHYVAPEYILPILDYARYQIATRFPNSTEIFIDETRKKLYEDAVALLKDPYIATSEPDYSTDPELSGTLSSKVYGASIFLPPMRFQDWWQKGRVGDVMYTEDYINTLNNVITEVEGAVKTRVNQVLNEEI